MTVRIDVTRSTETYRWQFVFVKNSVSVSWCALLRRCIEHLSSDVILVSWRKINFGFFESFEGSTVRKNRSQSEMIRNFLSKIF